MSGLFSAFRIHDENGVTRSGLESISLDDLSTGEVLIRTAWSSVNFKDALAATGKEKILRRSPLVGGIDVSGTVETSADTRFQPGDKVLVTGCGLSEIHDGGYAEFVRVPADWVITLPAKLSLYESMALGTAGFTAGLALQQMEQNGQHPELGPILVTGASGGVGSFAVNLFSDRGYEVIAVSGKAEAKTWLKKLGASHIIHRQELDLGSRALEQGRWGGAVDCVGGETLAGLTRTVKPWGNIASIGMTAGSQLHTTVMPFILRGVSILGITSSNCPMSVRKRIWQRLASDLRPSCLEEIVTKHVTLATLPAVFQAMLSGKTMGRTVVEINPS